MPFDNTNPDTKPATDEVLEALQLIREGVSRAWCRGKFADGYGRYCLVGWIREVNLDNAAVIRLLASQLVPGFVHSSLSYATHSLWAWNDSRLSNQPVIDLIDRAIEARKKA